MQNLYRFNLITNILFFFFLTPISIIFVKFFYGDLYFKNIEIVYIILIIHASLNRSFNNNINSLHLKYLSIIIILIILIIINPLINFISLLLIALLPILINLLNRNFFNFIKNKSIHNKIFVVTIILSTLLNILHIISYIDHISFAGGKKSILYLFHNYDWISNFLTEYLIIIFLIQRYYYKQNNFFIYLLFFSIVYFSFLCGIWIYIFLSLVILIVDFKEFLKLKNIHNLLFFSILLISLIYLYKFSSGTKIIDINNFFFSSVLVRINELVDAYQSSDFKQILSFKNYTFINHIDKNYHSLTALALYYYGLFGLFFLLILIFAYSKYVFQFNRKLSLILASFLFLYINTYSFIPPYIVIFLLLYKDIK